MADDKRESDDFVQSLSRGLAIIRSFDAENPRLSLSDVARRTDMSPAAARRFLRTLETLGYVRAQERSFELTPRVLDLGFSYLSALSLPEIMQPHLERLSREVDESVSAAVLSNGDIVYVARVVTRRIMTVGITIGTRFPAFATSMGRVLLSGLSARECESVLRAHPRPQLTPATVTDVTKLLTEIADVRDTGFALVDGELERGLRSVAVPVHDAHGATVAAINVSMGANNHGIDDIRQRLVPALRATAAAIEVDLSATTPRASRVTLASRTSPTKELA